MLDLRGCGRLVELPNNFGGNVPKLKRLELEECEHLRMLPDSIGLLTKLEHLDLCNCWELITLPNAIVGLVSLVTLKLSCWEMAMELGRLIDLHKPGVGLKKLKKLEMELEDEGYEWLLPTYIEDSSFMDIPTSVPARFDRLKALSVKYGGDVSMRLSDSLGAFTALQSLRILSAWKISRISQRLGELKYLRKVQILSCANLLHIEALPQCLEHLELMGCWNLIDIPSLKPMKSLVHLNLNDCEELRHIHGLECLTTLVFINLVGCVSLEDDGVKVNKDNKALGVCALSGSKVGVAYNNGWLEVRLLSIKFWFWCFWDIEPLNRMVAGQGCQFHLVHTLRSFCSFMES